MTHRDLTQLGLHWGCKWPTYECSNLSKNGSESFHGFSPHFGLGTQPMCIPTPCNLSNITKKEYMIICNFARIGDATSLHTSTQMGKNWSSQICTTRRHGDPRSLLPLSRQWDGWKYPTWGCHCFVFWGRCTHRRPRDLRTPLQCPLPQKPGRLHPRPGRFCPNVVAEMRF